MSQRRDPVGVGERRTVRQQLRALLLRQELDFETLRALLGLSVRDLESELLHVAHSARGRGDQLVVSPPRCLGCDFAFRDREARHLHAPGRCPECHSERISQPSFRILARDAS